MHLPQRFSKPALEPHAGSRVRGFQLHTFTRPAFDFVWHRHPEIELTFIRKGVGVRYAGSSIRPFHSGDLCLLGPNLPHAYGTHPGHSGRCEWTVIHFLPELWGATFWNLPENRRIRALLDSCGHGLHFPIEGIQQVPQLLERLEDLPLNGPQRVAGFLDLLHSLSIAPAGPPLDQSPDRTDTSDRRVARVLDWLESRADRPVRQVDAARLVRMSPAAFSRFFSQKTGRLFSRHLNEIRIARACVALQLEEKPIIEIAFEAGFNNLSNFNRRFLETMRMTPGNYRRMVYPKAPASTPPGR